MTTYYPFPIEIFLEIAEILNINERINLMRAIPPLQSRIPHRWIITPDATDRAAREAGSTMLHVLANNGDAKLLNTLLTPNTMNADLRNGAKRTPLSIACEMGHLAVIQLLCERAEVNVNSGDSTRRTPLSWAAGEGHSHAVRYLIERDDVLIDRADSWCQTPLMWAVQGGHESVVQGLLAQENIWGLASSLVEEDRALLRMDLVGINTEDESGRTPLLAAVYNGDPTMVKLLLTRGDVDVTRKYGNDRRTVLSVACEMGHLEIVRMLFDRGGLELDEVERDSKNPMIWASLCGHMDVVAFLASRGADPGDFARFMQRREELWSDST
ncbi:ankyrin repeat-containing domain protein [Aspergillus californicus]